jgi:hypothetical protein
MPKLLTLVHAAVIGCGVIGCSDQSKAVVDAPVPDAYEFARDGQAGSLMGAFDFTQPPRDPLILSTRTCQ